MAPGEDFDSGMESQETSAKDTTPEKKTAEIENDIDDEPDETISERLWGLAEMFPDSVRTASSILATNTSSGVKNLYNFSRNALWIVFSTSIILFAPVIFEVERAQLEEMQRNQQKQLLLGPNTAMPGGEGCPLCRRCIDKSFTVGAHHRLTANVLSTPLQRRYYYDCKFSCDRAKLQSPHCIFRLLKSC